MNAKTQNSQATVRAIGFVAALVMTVSVFQFVVSLADPATVNATIVVAQADAGHPVR